MIRTASRNWTDAEVQHVRDLFHAGEMTLNEIAKSYGIDQNALNRRRVRRSLGLPVGPTRPKGGWHAGNLRVPRNVHPLIRSFYKIVNREHATLKDVSRAAGLGQDAACRWKYYNPYLNNFDAALNVLGKKLAIVDIEPEDQKADLKNLVEMKRGVEVQRVLPKRHYESDFEVRE